MAEHSERDTPQRPARQASEPSVARPAAPHTQSPRSASEADRGGAETMSQSPRARPGGAAGPGVADQARDQARTLASEAKEQTAQLGGEARQRISSLVSEQKDRAATHLGSLAGVLREAAAKLGTDELGGRVGQYANRAADQVDSMSGYVRRSDLQTLIQDTGRFGRRRPEVFLGGTFLTGLILARFLKASSRDVRQPADWVGDR